MCYAPCGCCVCLWQSLANLWAAGGSAGTVCNDGETGTALESMGTAETVAGSIRFLVFTLLLGMFGYYENEIYEYDACMEASDGNKTDEQECSQSLTLSSRERTMWVINTMEECLIITGVWIFVAIVGAVAGFKGGRAEKIAEARVQRRTNGVEAESRAYGEEQGVEMVPMARVQVVDVAEPVSEQPGQADSADACGSDQAPSAYVVAAQVQSPLEPQVSSTFGQFRPPPPRGPIAHAMVVQGTVVNPDIRGMGTPLDGRRPPPSNNNRDRASSLDRNPVSLGRRT